MQDNQGPLTDNAEPSTPRWARKPFVSGHGRAMVAIGFLALSIVVSLLTITIVHDYFFIGVSPITIGGSLLSAAVGTGCVVSFLLWFRRVYRNLPAIGAVGARLLISAREHDAAMEFFERPVVRAKRKRQVVEELGLGGLHRAQPEIVGRLDERLAEMMHPDAIDEHAGHQRVGPVGKVPRIRQPPPRGR